MRWRVLIALSWWTTVTSHTCGMLQNVYRNGTCCSTSFDKAVGMREVQRMHFSFSSLRKDAVRTSRADAEYVEGGVYHVVLLRRSKEDFASRVVDFVVEQPTAQVWVPEWPPTVVSYDNFTAEEATSLVDRCGGLPIIHVPISVTRCADQLL